MIQHKAHVVLISTRVRVQKKTQNKKKEKKKKRNDTDDEQALDVNGRLNSKIKTTNWLVVIEGTYINLKISWITKQALLSIHTRERAHQRRPRAHTHSNKWAPTEYACSNKMVNARIRLMRLTLTCTSDASPLECRQRKNDFPSSSSALSLFSRVHFI